VDPSTLDSLLVLGFESIEVGSAKRTLLFPTVDVKSVRGTFGGGALDRISVSLQSHGSASPAFDVCFSYPLKTHHRDIAGPGARCKGLPHALNGKS
jgi:hypothetical protein